MMTWLKKLVLDILPSVAATIIGAYIVNHYIIPKSPSADSQPSIASAISNVFRSKPDLSTTEKASLETGAFEKGVAEKTAIEKTVEKAARDKAAAADKTAAIDKASDATSEAAAVEPRKHHPAPKVAAKPAAQDERKASDLARAALERLRGSNSDSVKAESTKTELIKIESAKAPADVPRIQSVSTITAAPPMQPLPPAINVARPNPDVFEQGNATPVVRQAYPQATSRQDAGQSNSWRFAPPADIPASRPMDLHAEASAPLSERTSVADEVVSAAKSMFHAVIPR